MKKIIIFNFDGVIFPNPDSLHLHVLNSHKFSYAMKNYMKIEKKIPEHFYEKGNIEGRKYVDAFWSFYSSLRMTSFNQKRLKEAARRAILIVLSCNEEVVIRYMLKYSGIDHLFEQIILVDKKPENKIAAFELLAEHYSVSCEEFEFKTNTVSGIREAQKAGVTDIYGVVADKNTKKELIEYVPEHKIIPAFYEQIN